MGKNAGNRQAENTCINTLGIMGKMGDTWKGVETSTKASETDLGVTKTSGGTSFCCFSNPRVELYHMILHHCPPSGDNYQTFWNMFIYRNHVFSGI